MARLKKLTVIGTLTAERLIGNADTATKLKEMSITGDTLASLAAGKYIYNASQAITFTDLPTFCANYSFSLEVIEISSTLKFQTIELCKEDSPSDKDYLLLRAVNNNQPSTWNLMGYSNTIVVIDENLKLKINDEELSGTEFTHKLGSTIKIEVYATDSTYKVDTFTLNGQPVANPYTYTVTEPEYRFVATEALNEATVNVTTADGVTIKINDVPVESGAHRYTIGQQLTIVAEVDEAYNLTSLKLDDQDIISGHSFTLTATGASIVATSAIKMYWIKVFNPENATIYVNGLDQTEYTFPHGTEINVNAVPNEGYEIARLDVSSPEDIYHLTVPESDQYTYTVQNVTDVDPEPDGTYDVPEEAIDPNGYAAGTLLKVNFKATDAYDITSITRDGRDYVNGGVFVVNYDNTFAITASIKMCNVRVYQPENGRIEINGQTGESFDFEYGTEISIAAIPDDGYETARLDVSNATDIYHLTIPESDQYTYTVQNVTGVTAGSDGTYDVPEEQINPDGYIAGTLLKVNFTASDVYNITSITRDGREYVNGSVFVVNYDNVFEVASSIVMYNIKVFAEDHATIQINGQTGESFDFPKGTSVRVEAIPEEGYEIARLDVSNADDIYHLTIPESENYTYTIQNVTDVTPEEDGSYNVPEEQINPEGYLAGTLLKVNFIPSDAYDITSITRDGREFVNGGIFVVNYDNTFAINGSIKMCNVRVIQPEVGGHIEINGETGDSFDFQYGTSITIETVPDAGYVVKRLDVSNATDLYAVNINSPNATVDITADRDPVDGKYYAGTKLTYNITPNEGYDITSITVNEEEVTTSGYWYINYDSDITVAASVAMVNIAVTQPENARIEVNGEVGTSFDFPKGTSVKIEAIPDSGYLVEHLYVTEVE